MDRLGLEEDMPIEHSMVNKAIENAQVRVEGYNFDIRKHVLEYDDVVNRQREIMYDQRRQILTEPSMRPTIFGMVEDELRRLVDVATADPAMAGRTLARDEWDLDVLALETNRIVPLPEDTDPERWRALNAAELADNLVALAEEAYDAKEAGMGPELMRQLERLVMLRAVDNRWVRHLTDLDELREGIGLRAIAQQDPLVAYKKEAHEMYQELVESISRDIVYAIYHLQIMTRPAIPVKQIQTNRSDADARPAPARTSKGAPGRNDPCPCGSGRKYKNCHMRSDQGRPPETAAAPAGAAAGSGHRPPRSQQSRPPQKGKRR
jgi:preprotein translocase subunit SecA